MKDEAMFRSAPMSLAQLYVSNEVAKEVIRGLGDLGCVQFRDLNSSVSNFQRAFVNEIKAADNCLRQVAFLRKNIADSHIAESPVWEGQQIDDADALPGTLAHLERQVTNLLESQSQIRTKQTGLQEHRHVLRAVSNFFGPERSSKIQDISDIVAGVIPRHLVPFLERVAWRTLRGNLVFSASEISTPLWDAHEKAYVDKSVFILITHGQELSKRALKISEAMDAHVYDVSGTDIRTSLDSINAQLTEANNIAEYTQQALDVELTVAARSIALWHVYFQKERLIYETLNRFNYDSNRKLLIGEGWVPTDEVGDVQQTLKHISESAQVESPAVFNLLETSRAPPTLHRTTKITESFQNMVDIYAVGTYMEINPGLPTIVTFPFMFAVMFGDLGHGFLMFLAALVIVLNEKKLAKVDGGDVFDMFYSGRYVVLLMGAFSMFTGFMYNDLFSQSMTLFKSGWEWPTLPGDGSSVAAVSTGTVYKFGMDWMWHGAENNLRFMNSYKMKLSVILGYVHMLYSYMFALANDVYFHSTIDIVGNFIPGLIFLLSIFGYLSICIVYKWCIDWSQTDAAPPSLMNTLINMFLAPGQIEEPLYKGQRTVQLILLAAALIAVPWLLLVKPLYLRKKLQEGHHELPAGEESGGDEDEGHHEESFGDIMIEQAIHTIEFCLNSVSHTASYLRLWALSLAHSQLSQVLWDMTLRLAFGSKGVLGVVLVVVMFAVWMVLTVAILTVMEGTSAMLHALRLHWVESMSKFYIGDGYAFEPFTFAHLE